MRQGKNQGYLRTRDLRRKSTQAFKAAAKESMELMGYVVIAEDGWIIKKYQDGRIERISQIVPSNTPFQLD